jgi:hypothetical protein
MLFSTHLGDSNDLTSITSWGEYIGRDQRRLWNKQNTNVKDFRACLDLFDTILDGYIIALIAKECGYESAHGLLSNLDQIGKEALSSAFERLGNLLSDYSAVTRMRQMPPEQRDVVYENMLVFTQQGMVLRTFGRAMRTGDSGIVTDCLAYFTVWFQATNKKNYARETIHWMACIKKLWSPEMKAFWMENCLVNPSGKAEGWMACDFLGEYVVGQVKKMMHPNQTAPMRDLLYNYVSLLIMSFLEVRHKMLKECDVPFSTAHSTKKSTRFEVDKIVERVFEEGILRIQAGRGARKEFSDLHGKGIQTLAEFKNIERYVKYMESLFGLSRPRVSEDMLDAEVQGEEMQENEEEIVDEDEWAFDWADFVAGWFDEEYGDSGEAEAEM